MTLNDFKASLQTNLPPNRLPVHLKSLWYDGKELWSEAHKIIDQLNDQDSAWIHAYLHRKEGDIWNADYWYRRANRKRPDFSLASEWEHLVVYFLQSV